MEIYPEDFWMTFKKSCVPQPKWLSTNVAPGAFPSVPPAIGALDPAGRKATDSCAMDFKSAATGSAEAGEGQTAFTERRKKKPALDASGTSRGGFTMSARRPEANSSISPLRGHRVADQEGTALRAPGRHSANVTLENVVVLRPRSRDYTYADFVLSALSSMFEAQAAGQKELLIARIKLVSHLLEDIGSRRRD